MSVKPPSESEKEYFFRQEVEKLKRMAAERQAEQAVAEREAQKKLHWMHCPKCGSELGTVSYGAVDIDRCFACGGIWLDDGELEKIVSAKDEREGSFLNTIFGAFKK